MHCLFVYLAYLYYLYGDDMAHELGNCYGKKTCAWRRENARKARRKLDESSAGARLSAQMRGRVLVFRLEQQSSRGWPIRTCVFIFMSF